MNIRQACKIISGAGQHRRGTIARAEAVLHRFDARFYAFLERLVGPLDAAEMRFEAELAGVADKHRIKGRA